MAMVLDAFASYLADLLTQVDAQELEMHIDASDEIDKMGNKLHDLKNFLADADRRNITDKSVQEWVGQLKRAMYEAADILDLCQLKVVESGTSHVNVGCLDPLLFCMQNFRGCFNPLLLCMQNPSDAHEIGTRIKALNQRLDTIKEQSVAFGFINLGPNEEHSSNMHMSHRRNPSREMSGDPDRFGVVGEKIEEDTKSLVAQIMQAGNKVNNNIMVLAIIGVGGVGKTTLAQKVFNDKAIQGEFSKKIWLSIDKNFSEVELLRRAVIEAGGDHRRAGNTKATLDQTLKDALIGHKTLLVMDDVWNHGVWEGVLKVPFNAAASGSQVLITTRDEGVALGMIATWPYHHVNTLPPDDAWLLLKKQVLSSDIDEKHINMLTDIGLKIIQKIGGLPLSIKLMGGLLRERGGTRHYWEKVLDDSKWSMAKMPRELNYAVYLSYEDMPSYLRQCFLYYSLLPKRKKFHVSEVVAMWISEGCIHGSLDDLEESGRYYYNELISRNLIEPDKSHFDQSYCSMHDIVRSFAQYMTEDEALIAHNGDINILAELNSQKFLRLSIEANGLQPGEIYWKSIHKQHVRTLISTIQIKMKHGDSLDTFSCLRVLHIESVDVATLVESLHQLKHLRYLALINSDIAVLPENIGNMKLLQFINLCGCTQLVKLPDSIVNLGQLRLLSIPSIDMIPRGFCSLTSMRRLDGFRAHMDGDWCSLDELGPLSQLRTLKVIQMESVSAASFAANARLGEKIHLIDLFLHCTSKLGDYWFCKEYEGISVQEQQRIEKVFDVLCPPPSVEGLHIEGYFGQQLPSWMMSTLTVPLNNLKTLYFSDLACCTQLPNGLCQLPYLQLLEVCNAPCIKRVGSGFFQAAATPFPRLNNLSLIGMVEWEEWEWEEKVEAMPRLDELLLCNCRLGRVPPGLASSARSLRKLIIQDIKHLSHLENFPFIVDLTLLGSPDLERITNFPNLEKLTITDCPKLNVVESIPALEMLVLEDYNMEELPEYMRDIEPRHFQLFCRLWLLCSVAAGQSSLEWDKFSHMEHVKAYAYEYDGMNKRKWYVLYTGGDNFKIDSNISRSSILKETLSSSMVGTQGFESLYKMRRSTFSYICSLVKVPLSEHMMVNRHTFVDERVLSLHDAVAIALRMLNSGETPEIVGSSFGVDGSLVSLLTRKFVKALEERAMHHISLSGSAQVEKIRRKFDKIHGLPNHCGVVHTTHIKFGSKNHENEENDGMLLHVVVDADMRFTGISLRPQGTMNKSRFFHDAYVVVESRVEGVRLNGRKLNVSSGAGLEVSEYVIGDIDDNIPWLPTPYELDNDLSLSDAKVEFKRRHSAATDVALRPLTWLKETWKCLEGEGWNPNNEREIYWTVSTCCMLHNIVIEMEKEGVGMPRDREDNYMH
ncbi:putative disease resistance RPP13-like protein 1 isoform X1 [Hordeum vulgare subsp. vulgare]|uniref:Uncharacterized protein n=1 Tax=Hordeum vulgare subsp. vulgare TaxID=112509 RepID=A0A8I6YKK9_HORVV|nr:putative disease resistance RPP13-like protein 1 isoform X1 [Hordeum vulgare subsp. vulgare]